MMKRHTPSPSTAPAASTGCPARGRALRVAAALVLPMGLLSACTVSVSSPQSQETPAQSASAEAEPTAQASSGAQVSVGPDGVSVTGGGASVSVGPGGVSVTDGSGSGSSSSGSTGSGSSGSGAAGGDTGTATDCSWLDAEIAPEEAVDTGSDTFMVTQHNETIRIANDLTTLTVAAANADVVVMNADHVVVNSGNADVYVCNVKTVTVNSGASNAAVYWGPGVTPVVQDFGSNTTTRTYS